MNELKFGFSISKSNRIDLDKNDFSLAQKLAVLEPSYRICMQCGTCSGTCTAGQFTSLSMRKLNALLSRGELNGIAEILEKCMFCGKCKLLCPRGVNTRNVIMQLRRLLEEQKLELNIKN
jgi:heterodisulfide reductase subunit C